MERKTWMINKYTRGESPFIMSRELQNEMRSHCTPACVQHTQAHGHTCQEGTWGVSGAALGCWVVRRPASEASLASRHTWITHLLQASRCTPRTGASGVRATFTRAARDVCERAHSCHVHGAKTRDRLTAASSSGMGHTWHIHKCNITLC